MKKIALFGGSFDPPTITHFNIALQLAGWFDKTIIRPCGVRTDGKETVNCRQAEDRAEMCRLQFNRIKPVILDLSDLGKPVFTRTIDWYQEMRARGEIWIVVGDDLVIGGGQYKAQIMQWKKGDWLWQNARFAIFVTGYLVASDLPPRHRIFHLPSVSTHSAMVRENLRLGLSVRGMVLPSVANYIEQHGLYRESEGGK